MQLPLTLRPRPSRILGAALILMHGLAAAGLAPISLPVPFKLLGWTALAFSLVFYVRRHVLHFPLAALTLGADGHLAVERPDGTRADAEVHPQTTVFPWLVVLLLKADGWSLALPLPPDALDADAYRQLRLWLRWKAGTAA